MDAKDFEDISDEQLIILVEFPWKLSLKSETVKMTKEIENWLEQTQKIMVEEYEKELERRDLKRRGIFSKEEK